MVAHWPASQLASQIASPQPPNQRPFQLGSGTYSGWAQWTNGAGANQLRNQRALAIYQNIHGASSGAAVDILEYGRGAAERPAKID